MVVIGLGSNLGTPLAHLRQALRRLRMSADIRIIGISSVYHSDAQVPEASPSHWQMAYLNMAIACHTDLSPEALLKSLKVIEATMGRPAHAKKWAPRVIDLDILIWQDLVYSSETVSIPHPTLFDRPFALLPLLELVPGWQHPALAQISWLKRAPLPFNTRKIKHCLAGPALMGIVNITPDSFSDGGECQQVEQVLLRIQELVEAGAELIDIGAESTRPGASLISCEQEWQRLAPVLAALPELYIDSALKPEISIDTTKAETVIRALDYDIDWINDVSGQECEAIAAAIRGGSTCYVSMHNLGVPPKHMLPANCNPLEEIYAWAERQLTHLIQHGLAKEQIIIDVGIGFGLDISQSWQVLSQAGQFKKLEVPILIGHSRKSFMSIIEPMIANRDLVTAVIANHLAQQHIDFLRIHNVAAVNQALTTQHLLNKEN